MIRPSGIITSNSFHPYGRVTPKTFHWTRQGPDGGIYATLRQAGTHGRRRVDDGRQREPGKWRKVIGLSGDQVIGRGEP